MVATQNKSTVLLNGINICDAQTGHKLPLISQLTISEIERIEVLEGPAARVYGTSSLLGAINIVTRTPQKTSLSAHIEGGSYGYLSAGIRGNIASKDVGTISYQLLTRAVMAIFVTRQAASTLITALQKFLSR